MSEHRLRSRVSSRALRICATGVVLATLASVNDAHASVPPSLAPGTKANNFDFGPASGIGLTDGDPLGGAWLDFLHHFRGTQEGPALGVLAIVNGWPGRVGFSGGLMFEWDFRLVPSEKLGLYLGPHFSVGVAAGSAPDRDGRKAAYVGAYAMAGPTLKLSFLDFWSFWVRPLNFEMYGGGAPGGGRLWAGYGGALGAGLTF